LHLLTPSLPQRIEQKQEQQKLNHDKRAVERSFTEGEKVYARKYSNIGKKWLPRELSEVNYQRSVNIKLSNGLVIHRHFNQICKRTVDECPEKDPDVFADFLSNTDTTDVSGSATSSDSPVSEQLPSNCRYPLKSS